MAHIHVAEEAGVPAPPERVYEFLGDYADSRPRILTDNYREYTVEEGGHGAGTVFGYLFQAARRARRYRMRVEAPDTRTLIERDLGSSLVTRWTVDGAPGGGSQVRIETDWEGGHGIGGFFERTFAPRGLKRIYAEELRRLAHAVGDGRS